MCDYSLQNVKSHPAKVGEKLRIRSLQYGHARVRCSGRYPHCSLCSSGNRSSAFPTAGRCSVRGGLFGRMSKVLNHRTAIFLGQINKDNPGQPIMMPWSFQTSRPCC